MRRPPPPIQAPPSSIEAPTSSIEAPPSSIEDPPPLIRVRPPLNQPLRKPRAPLSALAPPSSLLPRAARGTAHPLLSPVFRPPQKRMGGGSAPAAKEVQGRRQLWRWRLEERKLICVCGVPSLLERPSICISNLHCTHEANLASQNCLSLLGSVLAVVRSTSRTLLFSYKIPSIKWILSPDVS